MYIYIVYSERGREGGKEEGREETYINALNACVPFKLSFFLINLKARANAFTTSISYISVYVWKIFCLIHQTVLQIYYYLSKPILTVNQLLVFVKHCC